MEQECLLGINISSQLGSIIDRFQVSNILIVRGDKSYETSGAKVSIQNALKGKKIKSIEYYGFQENPKIEDVEIGKEILHKNPINLVIGIGGGSVLDMSKLIRFLYSYDIDDQLENCTKKRDTIPLIAIPTTSGTGSEATHFAVVYKNKKKYSIAHESLLPDIAIIDPIFTYDNPKYVTACTGFDALSQAIEAYWNINATEESNKFAIRAINLLWKNLHDIVNNPTKELRNLVSEGSHFAGKAINITKTTAPHAFSYPFTTYYGYPHGHAVALTFPFFIEFNYGIHPSQIRINVDNHHKKMRYLYNILSINDYETAGETMFQYLNTLGLSLVLPNSLKKELIIENINLQRLTNNPVTLRQKDIDLLFNSLIK